MHNIKKKCCTAPSETQRIKQIVAELVGFINQNLEIDTETFTLVLSEAVTNAILHGNKSNPAKKVSAEASVQKGSVILKVSDEGEGFDHKNVPDPTKEENLLRLGGRGIYIIRVFMDEVQFNEPGNAITMTKYLNNDNRS